MRKKFRQILAALLVAVMLVGVMPVGIGSIKASAAGSLTNYSTPYKNSKFYKALCNVKLTGNQRDDIVNVAKSQIGYQEGLSYNDLDGCLNGGTTKAKNMSYLDGSKYSNYKGYLDACEYNYWMWNGVGGGRYISSTGTKSGASYPVSSYDRAWCATFVSWCARQAGISTSIIKNCTFASPLSNRFNLPYKNRGSYTPQKGDIIFFNYNGDANPKWSHVGIVESVGSGKVTYIDGNGDDNVSRHTLALTDKHIRAYGIPEYYENLKPETPTISVSVSGSVAVGTSVTVSWNSNRATSYDVSFTNATTLTNTTKTSQTYTLTNAGKYSVTVIAKNSGGSVSASKSSFVTAYNPTTVIFKDYDGKVLNTQKVKYNGSAIAPDIPSREGYTFIGWDNGLNNIKSDTVITAQYKINTYKIKFVDYNNNTIKEQTVNYLGSVTPPDESNVPLKTGYVFKSWDSEKYNNVKEDATIRAIYIWSNNALPIVISNAAAKRDEDGYMVTFDITNYPDARTSGRAVVALKTAEGKLIETTESAAFSLAKNETKTKLEVYCPTQEAATKAEIIIVDSYSSGVPISLSKDAAITNGLEWSNWSDTAIKSSDDVEVETRTVYRYRDKLTTPSSSSSLSGWILYNSTWVWSDYGSWSAWSSTKPTASDSREVDSPKIVETYYKYFHYCKSNWTESYSFSGSTYHEKGVYKASNTTWTRDPNNDSDGMLAYKYGSSTSNAPRCSHNCYAYYRTVDHYDYNYRYRDRSKIYTYYFYKWNAWSDWSPNPFSPSDSRQVETKTQYRCRNNFNNAGIEDATGSVRTYSANLGTSFGGKQATLYIYKIDEASDWTNEFVGQGTVADNGLFSITYKLREEPSIKTGDFTVAIGIEGMSNLIIVDTIKAPKPTYTVNFYDSLTGKLVSSQQIIEGNSAVLPENPEHTGYTFVGWSENFTNIKCNLDLQSRYIIDTYAVTFVDWETQTLEMREFEYGQPIVTPDIDVPEGYILTGWTNLNEGDTASKNMICEAICVKQIFMANIYNSDNSILETATVEYGDFIDLPVDCEKENSIFQYWEAENGANLNEEVTSDLEIYPVFVYEDTTENPVSSVKTGVYDNNQTITLSCPTSGAEIRYTTEDYVDLLGDSEYYEIYDGPITLDYSANLRFVAVGDEMNPSDIISETIAINSENNVSPWMIYDDIPTYVFNNLDKYRLEADTGYKYKDTVTVSSVSEKESLLADGWTLVDFTLGQPSDWSFDVPELDDVDYEISSQKVLIDESRFKYTHYKYYDSAASAYVYSNVAVEDTDGEWEEYICENKLSIAGFASGTTIPYYNYNGQRWFNQESIEIPVEYTMYSYQIKNYNLYKWTDWTTDAPSVDETREYATDTVYQFTAPKMVIVNAVDNDNKVIPLLALYGMPVDLSDVDIDVEGYKIKGYYTDKDFNNEWDMNTPVTESITLYPKYEVKTFTVKFVYENGTVIDTQTVNYGDSAKAPENFNIEDGYAFVKWSKDSFDNVTSDMDIVAIIKPESEITKVVLNKQSFSTTIGSSVKLTATVTPDNLENKSVSWSSNDVSVAEIDSNGYVTAVSAGETVITATAFDGTKASCTITVMPDASTKVSKIQLSENDISIVRYTTKQLTATVLPETSINKKVVWTSSNDKIASVDENGIVTGNMAGTAIITATSQDGGYKDYCLIKVIGVNTLSTASIDFDSGIITGLAPSINSLDKYLSVSDDSCQITFDTLGTDSIVYITRDNEIVEAYTVVIFGDVNGDGVYDGMDAMIVNCIANGMLTKEQVGEAVYMAADCNHDGVIDSLDVELLQQAGVLLANVDQSKTQEELQTSSAYVEYLNLIDQNVDEAPDTPSEIKDDNNKSESYSIFTFISDFFAIIKRLLAFIQTIFA